MKAKLFPFLFLLLLGGCTHRQSAEADGIHQTKRLQTVDISSQIRVLNASEYRVALSGTLVPYVIGPYVMIADHNMINGAIHVFEKETMRYLSSFGRQGSRLGEITALGHVAWDEERREVLVEDLGHLLVYAFPLKEVLENPEAEPSVKVRLDRQGYPQHFYHLQGDQWFSLLMTRYRPTRQKQVTGIFDMTKGTYKEQDYTHPNIDEKRVSIDVDRERDFYVEANHRYDLLSIIPLPGGSPLNIYGPLWDAEGLMHFDDVAIGTECIYALYNGHPRKSRAEERTNGKDYAHDIVVFDQQGNYLQTWHSARPITHLCCDREYHQLILTFADTERRADELFGTLKITNLQ